VRLRLVADTVRGHRTGIALWLVVGAATQYLTASMLVQEFNSTPGGAAVLAPSVEAAAQALRMLRWPAERLDTLGGYLTYHNILLLPLFLGLYAAMAGAKALRGAESSGSLEEVLATGWSRIAVVRDRALGFLVVLVAISIGVTLGTYAGLMSGGEQDLLGSTVSIGEAALCAFTFYALAMLVSQLTRSARSGTGVTVLVMSLLYVFTNLWDKAGPLAVVRFLSPFYYFQESRALVPGHSFNPLATLALAAISILLLGVAAWVFERRDYASPLWGRTPSRAVTGPVSVRRPWLAAYWSASLVRQLLGLLAWATGTAAFAVLVTYLEPEVRSLWDRLEYFKRFLAITGADSLTAEYLAFAGGLLAPVVAAYAATQVAAWISELREGRVELLLAAPLSWSRLVLERLLALTGGVAVITAAAVAGLLAGALAAGVPLRADGLARLAGVTMLFGVAIGAIGAVLAGCFRTGLAATALVVFLVASYLVQLLGPAYSWPDWVTRLSVFDAFGRPYLEVPPAAGLILLGSLVLVGSIGAAWLSERSPKVA